VATLTDAEKLLLKRSQQGDVAAFEQLIAKHQTLAYNVAYRILGNEEDAKDATQEALIKVFRNINKFKGDASFGTWLYRIVVNSCNDYIRKHRKVVTYSIDNEIETDEGTMKKELADESPGPELAYETKDMQKIVQTALGKLPEANRIVVVLRDIQGFSYDEIAQMIEVPVGTVKSRINRGRDMLKNLLTSDQSFTFDLAR
jgi:RNA polymerase sigma-70 factor (ECF subfamily)